MTHGFHIGIERLDNQFFLAVRAVGKLTHEDYQKITPLIDNALAGLDDADVRVLADISEFSGWELRAAWDDFKLGIKHGKQFKKIAIVGQTRFVELTEKVSRWFTSGEVRHFDHKASAMEWLTS